MGLKIRYFDEDNDDTLNKTLSMTGQPQSLAVFKALGLSDPAAERLHSLWNKKDNKDPSIDICRFVISHIKERQFMAPFVYLIGIDNLATFSMRLGITSELVQQAIDLFKSANNGGLVMGTMRWLEQAIKIRWGRLRDASGYVFSLLLRRDAD